MMLHTILLRVPCVGTLSEEKEVVVDSPHEADSPWCKSPFKAGEKLCIEEQSSFTQGYYSTVSGQPQTTGFHIPSRVAQDALIFATALFKWPAMPRAEMLSNCQQMH